ncbi:MAG: OmpA family protein [Rickettsiaceae bacterium H1]|nr:OmpA family protein [Rickettsiaceae bacterium H1]
MLKKVFLSSAILLLVNGCLFTENGGDNKSGCEEVMVRGNDTTFFAFDSSELSEKAKGVLGSQVKDLKRNKSDKIIIVGHCDDRGPGEYNIALGERRANAVKSYLESEGISSSRIKVDSMGKEALRCDTTNPMYQVVSGDEGMYHKQNRRAVTMFDDGTVDHNKIIKQERERCVTPGSVGFFDRIFGNDVAKMEDDIGFFDNVLSNDTTNDHQDEEPVIVTN